VRVLILSTPFDARARLDGSRRAVADLVAALAAERIAEPTVLVGRGGEAPPGARGEFVGDRPVEAFLATLLAQTDVLHSWFAPRAVTASALRLVRLVRRLPVVQTVPSIPRSWWRLPASLCGDVVVTQSDATAIAFVRRGVDARSMMRLPAPFAPPGLVEAQPDAPRDMLLFAGDLEFDDGLERTLSAFATMSVPSALVPHLCVATRDKTARARAVEARLARKVRASSALRERVTFLGEVPSLLPWIAAARAVVLPASTTYAKLDHPRVLLEAIALGVRIIVGAAPSLGELCDDPRVGEVARSTPELRAAMERAFELPAVPSEVARKLLAPTAPVAVARRYGQIYRGLTDRRP
jgi:glycosyltransferase involved in cell wall biosynthesis